MPPFSFVFGSHLYFQFLIERKDKLRYYFKRYILRRRYEFDEPLLSVLEIVTTKGKTVI